MRGRIRLLCRLGLMLAMAAVAGCATVIPPELAHPVSEQTLEYYPGLVKGFEHTYPLRTLLVLAVDAPCQSQSGAAASDAPPGDFQVGETVDLKGELLQRLYMAPIQGNVQRALIAAATEAGLRAHAAPTASYSGSSNDDYVLRAKVLQCSIKKQRVALGGAEPSWQTVANFALDVSIFKPPFHVAFWQGTTIQTYTDPPDAGPAGADEDEVSIYDQPGQVLSVAFTRAVEGIFARPDLHSLITEDRLVHQ